MRSPAFAAAVAAALLVATPASAHWFLGYDSVDNGEIRYEDESKYSSADGGTIGHAIDTWNALNPINIKPDAWNTATDLTWRDYSNADTTTQAYYHTHIGSDHIHMNTAKLDNLSLFKKKAVAAHEQGHSLGLDHNETNDTQLMWACPTCTSINTPQSHDKQDYHELWGY